MRATRRTAVTASGVAALGLTGCTGEPSDTSSNAPATTSSTAAETTVPDPDEAALERAIALSAGLLAELQAARPALDPAGRLAELHASHLAALREASDDPSDTAAPLPSGPRLTAERLVRMELAAHRELARLARRARSGPLARVLASMSAGIAAGLSRRGEVAG